MNKILIIATRELLETVKTRTFFFSVVLVPILISGMLFGMDKIYNVVKTEQRPARKLVLLDRTGQIGAAFAAQVEQFNKDNPFRPFVIVPAEAEGPEELRARVSPSGLFGVVEVPAEVLAEAAPTVPPVTIIRADSQLEIGQRLERLVQESIVAVRFAQAQPPVDWAKVQMLQRPVQFSNLDARTGAPFASDKLARVMTPFVFMFLLWMGTMGMSQGLLTSLIEEKSSRIIEVLLSAATPTQLMAGKILGMVGVGLIMMAIWGLVGLATARSFKADHLVTGSLLFVTILYFIPGFLFSAAFLGGLGAACNTLKDAQTMATPLSLLNMIPISFWFPISQLPDSTLALVLSFIPPITPAIMVLRVCSDPNTPLWQIVATQALLWATVLVTIWFAAKVFRVGVLMYGKPPTLAEMWRWAREA